MTRALQLGRRSLGSAWPFLVVLFIAGVGLFIKTLTGTPPDRPLWMRYRLELERRGEPLAWQSFTPPRVKDEANFFEAPEMMAWFSKRCWLSHTVSVFQLPPQAGGRPVTLSKLRSVPDVPEADSAIPSEWPASRQEVRQWFTRAEPQYRLLRNASLRPSERLNTDYSEPFKSMDQVNFGNARAAVQALATHANLNWIDRRPDDALEDLRILERLAKVSASSPTVVGGMIHIAIWGLCAGTISDALRAGVLRDSDLQTIQKELQEVNLLESFTRSLRAERAAGIQFLDRSPREMARLLFPVSSPIHGSRLNVTEWLESLRERIRFRSSDWIDRNQVLLVRTYQDTLDEVDASHGRIHAQALTRAGDRMQENFVGAEASLASMMVPNFFKASWIAVQQQTLINQLQIACGLERYRRARGQFPQTLDDLLPGYLAALPGDLFTNAPLGYRRTSATSYQLWSVGWDEHDDGGLLGPLDANGKPIYGNQAAADWVWPATSAAETSP